MSSGTYPHEVLSFYVTVRKNMLEVNLQRQENFLDEFGMNFQQLNEVFLKVFGPKTSRKIHLLRNVNESTKASSVLSNIIIDWLAQKKKTQPIKVRSVSITKGKEIKM